MMCPMNDIKSIFEKHRFNGEKVVFSSIESLSHLRFRLATEHTSGKHFVCLIVNKDIEFPDLKPYNFVGVQLFTNEIQDEIHLNILLLDVDLKEEFFLFVQNIVNELEKTLTEQEAVKTLFNVISRWKRLFNRIYMGMLTKEQQKGLLGELLYIDFLLSNDVSSNKVIRSWFGIEFEDKDFVFENCAMEIKFSSNKVPYLNISSERQLDITVVPFMYLVLYPCNEVQKGDFSLNSVIERIREKLQCSGEDLILFNEKLIEYGYLDDDKIHYEKQYALLKTYSYSVTSTFPRIVKDSIPIGIYNTNYKIEISAVEDFRISLIETIAHI